MIQSVKITAVILTLNEERNLERCLLSIKSFADELLVVDSYSNDGTEKIAISHGARFIQNKFEGFIEQIRFATEKAAHDRIFIIDADEEASAELQNSILKIKENWETDGYYFNRLANYCGQWIYHCGWYPDKKLRLINRLAGHWGGENPHHKFIPKNPNKIGFVKGDLYHYAFQSIQEHVTTTNKYSEVAANEIIKKNKTVYFLVHVIGNPLFTFISKYLFKRGFLDGYNGFVICWLSAQANFLKYSKAFIKRRSNRAS